MSGPERVYYQPGFTQPFVETLPAARANIPHTEYRRAGECPKCGDESLPERLTGSANALCDDCLGDHLDLNE